MFVNRGIYHQGWTAVTRHSIPFIVEPLPACDDDVWELYSPEDWTQAHDLAKEMPEKLHELQRLFLIEAVKYNVLPLDDRRVERFNSDLAGRPTLIKGRTQLLFDGMQRLTENVTLNLKNTSHAVTAEVWVPDKAANGVIITQGGQFGGWSLSWESGRRRKKRGGAYAPPQSGLSSRAYGQAFPSAAISLSRPGASFGWFVL